MKLLSQYAATIAAQAQCEVEIPKAPRTPWLTLEAALLECEQENTAAAHRYISVQSTLVTVRPGCNAA
jgi:hypothetical protein